jgi:hypothetical protein
MSSSLNVTKKAEFWENLTADKDYYWYASGPYCLKLVSN